MKLVAVEYFRKTLRPREWTAYSVEYFATHSSALIRWCSGLLGNKCYAPRRDAIPVEGPFMDREITDRLAAAREHAWSIPLEDLNVAKPELFRNDTVWPYFERLRQKAPVHYCRAHEVFGPYWSITKYNDIMAVDTNHEVFSSEPAITIVDPREDSRLPMFIAMDPPRHEAQRKVVSPIVSGPNLESLEPLIRARAGAILDGLPTGETIDWVDKVSIELTTMTLATL